MKRLVFACMAGIFPAYILLFVIQPCRAGSATWLEDAQSHIWNESANWTGGGPPNGPSDVATFAHSNFFPATIMGGGIEVNAITFNSGANTSSFVIMVLASGLTVSGAGVINNSSVGQTFEVSRSWFMSFTNSATAISGGSANYFTKGGESFFEAGGQVIFRDNSTAAFASFGNLFGINGGRGGTVQFLESSTAGHGSFNNGGNFTNNGSGGETDFFDNSSADHGTFTNDGGHVQSGAPGVTRFFDSSTAAQGIFLNQDAQAPGAPGGAIVFEGDSTGGTSQIKFFGNGFLDISTHNFPGVGIGSIEGTGGNVLLGNNNLTVGTNNLSTSFSGTFQDSGQGGSLTKVGMGTLTLTSASFYTGGTTITAGTLEAKQDGALGGGDVSMLLAGPTLTLQDGASNDYIADTATVDIVTTATLNLNFTGTDTVGVLIIDGVAQPPALYGTAAANRARRAQSKTRTSGIIGTGHLLAQLPVAVSRKVHNGTPFDVYLPLTGPIGVECRDDGNHGHKIVVNFLNNATFDHAAVSGGATLDGASGGGTKTVTIDLSAVANEQVINVTLFDLDDGLGMRDLVIPIGVLVGDTTGNGLVNDTDVSQVKSESGKTLSIANFRADIIVNGAINATDISNVKKRSGTGLNVAALRLKEGAGETTR